MRVTVLVSGGGSNLQALLDAQDAGRLGTATITAVIASRAGVYALERAEKHGVPTAVVSRGDYENADAWAAALTDAIERTAPDLVVLAGYLSILPAQIVTRFTIINIHPALIPAFCGAGMYGLRPHVAALARGVKVTGATVHYVNEIPDGGEILAQKAVDVHPDDTPETLQRRVMEEAEWVLLPSAVAQLSMNNVQ
ncbi:MAG: phosphoribosylglycinamide formyltransferase [Oscillospiraceae bacterium]|jgi:phosphoribosylglycinamide formyltransferase-1|nr:phosphoribosylglycinamide formyltransferase [Oscillospiraceae bacterium]